jgi:hypothetical protein
MDITPATGGPGRYLADHPAIYRLSLAGSTATAAYAAVRARRAPSARIPWTALALLEAAITAGIMNARRRREARGDPGNLLRPAEQVSWLSRGGTRSPWRCPSSGVAMTVIPAWGPCPCG